MNEQQGDAYAARLEIAYPERLDRVTSAFRILWAIPIFVILALLGGGGPAWADFGRETPGEQAAFPRMLRLRLRESGRSEVRARRSEADSCAPR